MMANGAWGPPLDTDSSSDDSSPGQSPMQENPAIECVSDEDTMLGNSIGCGISCGSECGSEAIGYAYSRHQINYKISKWKETLESASVPIAIPNKLRYKRDAVIDGMELLNINALPLPRNFDRHEGMGAMGNPDNCDEDENLDECLPELSMTFVDPEKSHFEELLYWLYTGDNSRWLRFFAPENYGSILENIRLLNISATDAVDVCLLYESKTSPHMGLKGMAQAILCEPQADDDNMDF
ncbi:hypothetical protein BGZ80_003188 [Entomortierella chlamydospora]|uniref:Uncharacterized protein n=1 Tax=Entomortierella chlamydospora TaxID=101097 RepID=A0A9P6T2U6_9FUNG|nr:hypothetical protein BGZ80_003188 [Entomortierella chlamydospora]